MTLVKTLAGFFFDTVVGKALALAGLVAFLAAGFALDQRRVGALTERQKTETQNEKAKELAHKGGSASRRRDVGGLLDPYTRTD